MTINKKFIDLFHNVSVRAAIASYSFVGKKDKIAADKAAVDSMRFELNKMDIKGRIVIGEGELDEAPMLYIGEMLGTKKGPDFDIAVDPVEGTNFAAKFVPSNGSTAMSILGPFIEPNFSPMYNIGASSSSPSPITTSPIISILFNSDLIVSTAALSAAILSFFPTKYDDDRADLVETFNIISSNFFSSIIILLLQLSY